MSDEWGEHNIYRDGRVHVLSEQCATCIFNPHTRPVEGSRVAEMVRETMEEAGATVVCHHTLTPTEDGRQINAVCRGWYDRLGDGDWILRAAAAMDVIEWQEEVSH